MAKLTPGQIKTALPRIPDWKKQSATIIRTFQFEDFVVAMKFVNRVARVAEAAAHHPDIDIRWNKVTLALSTHSEGGLTRKDFALAKKIDELVADAK
jgi:4a-hydroxytetrahydrobiopterin dehydratase